MPWLPAPGRCLPTSITPSTMRGTATISRYFPIANALLATTPASQSATTFAYPGATPSISSNGTQNGIVWAIETQSGAGILHAYATYQHTQRAL